MINLATSAHRASKRRAVAHIAQHEFAINSLQRAAVSTLAHQRPHMRVTRGQSANHMAANKPVGAGNKSNPIGHYWLATRAATAAAAERPAIPALSIVAGSPV